MTFIIEHLDRGDNLLSATNELRVKQNPGFGEFDSIALALASISGSSDTNRFVIKVFPGIYIEPELDFAAKPYVSLVGSSIQSVVIKPAGSHNIMKLGVYNEVSYCWLEDSAIGYAAVRVDDSGNYSQLHKVTFNNCYTGIYITSDTQDTYFYGEYIDFNGSFLHSVKVESSNGFTAFANLENYYVYPTDIGMATEGLYVTGTSTQVYVNSCGFTGAGVGTGVYVDNGADLNISDVYIGNFNDGIINGNVGSGVLLDLISVAFKNNANLDLQILQPTTTGAFTGTSSHQLIDNQAPAFSWSFLDTVDGEMEISNKLSITFDDGTHTDLSTILTEGGTMGVIEGGLISDYNGTLDLLVAEGFGYLDNNSILHRYDWVDTILTLSADTTHHIYLNSNGILDAYLVTPSSLSNSIYLGKVRTGATTIDFIDTSKMNAHHIGNALSTFNRVALGNIYASGSSISEGTALKLNVTSGLYFRSENVYAPQGGTDITFTQYNKNGSSTFVTTVTDTVNNTQYNNGNTLSSLTSNYYTKHSLYVIGDAAHGNEKYLLVLGQAEYSTLLLAQAGAIPTPPTYFDRGVVLIGIIYIQKGASNIALIEDARPIIGFKPITTAGISDHGSLSGLGNNDHPQYLLASGVAPMAGDLDLGGNNLTNINLVDGVDVSAHASRHLPNGSDPLTTAAPTTNLGGSSTNAVGIQNNLSRSDHSHAIDIANTTTTGLLTSTDWNTFNNKQSALVSGTNIKTIEGQSLLGSGNINLTSTDVGLGNVVNLDTSTTSNITDSTNKRFVTDANLIVIGNTSGTNTGNQTSIVGISGTKAEFDAACTDGNFLYTGDITQYTDELAQDAVGAMVDSTLVYVDATPLLTRAAITGDVSIPQASNTSTIGTNVVTNAKLAQAPTLTIKGNSTAGTSNPQDLTVASVKTMLGLGGKNEVFFAPSDMTLTAVTVPTAAAATQVIQSSVTGIVAVNFSGTADQNANLNFRVPTDYLSGGRFKVLFSASATSGTNFVLAPIVSIKSLAASLATITETLTPQTIQAGTINLLQETGFFTPATSFTAGQFVSLRVTRPASTNASDNYTSALFVNGVIFEYDSSK
jgi:hypothetical protein